MALAWSNTPPTNDHWMDGYQEWLVGRGLSPKTVRLYELRIEQASTELTRRGTDLDSAKPTDIAAIADGFPKSSSTLRQLRTALKHYYEMTDRRQAPYRAVRVPKKPEPKSKALSPEDASRLAKVAECWHPEGTATMFGLYMALRAFEISSVRWSRFTGDMEWYTVTGKGDRTHTLPVHPKLADELEVIRRFSRDDYLFPGQRGRDHITGQTVWNWVRKVGEEAGIDGLHPHVLRHTALTTANDRTGDLRGVSRFARHQQVQTTMRYTRTSDDQLKRVMRAIDYGL